MFDFTGRTVVITGGTGVLGREIAVALAKCGANAAILNRDVGRAAPVSKFVTGVVLPIDGRFSA